MKQWLERLRGKQYRDATIIDRREVPKGECQLCNADGVELRPYGPNGEWICFHCGMKAKSATEAKMGEILFGDKRH
jgi:hypothetical protein